MELISQLHFFNRAFRYCGITFAYTAISILLNYSMLFPPTSDLWTKLIVPVTPPNAVGFANGIAQSIVSLARCFGPILGGYVCHNSFLVHGLLLTTILVETVVVYERPR